MAKRYYWLKLPDGFFRQKAIKKLRKIAGGDTYTIIYLKMLLVAMKQDGRLYFEGVEATFYDELALDLDEEVENVRVTVMFLIQQDLMQLIDETEYSLSECAKMTGSESANAARVRKYRSKEALQCNTDVTKSNTEIEIENRDKRIEIENRDREREKNDTPTDTVSDTLPDTQVKPGRHKYGEYSNVLLSDAEYEKLMVEIPYSAAMIERLSEYIASTGKKYKSHYATIRSWHRRDSEKQQVDKAEKNMTGTSFNDIDF